MKKKLIGIILVLTLVAIAFAGCTGEDEEEDDDWGEEGELKLTITIERTEMSLNETIGLEYNITNIGDTDLRVLYPIGPQIEIFDSFNNSVQWVGAVIPTPPSPTNDDLEILEKGESKNFNYIISIDLNS